MKTAILWFRQDLRLEDNPALIAACHDVDRLLPVYILETDRDPWAAGAASRWWLHHSLAALDTALHAHGSRLHLMHGKADDCLAQLIGFTGAGAVYWNRRFEPAAIARDKAIKQQLQKQGIGCHTDNARLLIEPWNGLNKQGKPYRVFTPFWRNLQPRLDDLQAQPPPAHLPPLPHKRGRSLSLKALGLLPEIEWDKGFYAIWEPGEAGAQRRLAAFVQNTLTDYPDQRDQPAVAGTSGLSPHLHFGDIGPRQILDQVRHFTHSQRRAGIVQAAEAFLRELAWREFAHHLLYYFPDTTDKPLDPRFEHFPWAGRQHLQAWQRGRTGIPLVDAGMRELWHTGWMHNRVRMIVASFLTKNLRIHWREGARWFWDTLVDADLANNTLGWQWTAGSGADASPYFRIFNPVTQARKFDPDGDYLRHWLPELAQLPDKWLPQPWLAPTDVLQQAGVELGRTYPAPLVDIKASREQALAAWDKIKSRRDR